MGEKLSGDVPYFCEEGPADDSEASNLPPVAVRRVPTECIPLPPPEEFRKLPGYTPAGLVSEETKRLACMGVPLPPHCEGQPLVDPREL